MGARGKRIVWDEESINTLKRLWPTKTTAKEIGLQLVPQRSKSAVIGQADRLLLADKEKPKVVRRKKKAGRPIQIKPKAPKVQKEQKAKAVVAAKERIKAEVPVIDVPPLKLVSTTDLRPRMCRWPYGDPAEANFGHCGCRANGVYCATHSRIAYRPYERKSTRSIGFNFGTRRA